MKSMNRTAALLALVLLVFVVAAGCQVEPQIVEKIVTQEVKVTVEVPKEVEVIVTQEVPVEVVKEVVVTPVPDWVVAGENLKTALHHTTRGMDYFYSAEQGGVEALTGVPYDELQCKNCHVPEKDGEIDCSTCHVTQVSDAPPQFKCMSCHGRQNFEIMARKPDGTPGMTDVHYAKGMQCINCHGSEQIHGDGETYNSLHEMDLVACTDCHQEVSTDVQAHALHGEDMDCAACHVKNVINCVNCHFDTELEGGPKVAATKYFNWKFLLKDAQTGKITTGILMSMVTGEKSFVAVAPFYGHTVTNPDPETVCAECHNSPALAEYNETGKITVQTWDEAAGKFKFATGVIPLPPDYEDAYIMDFVTRDGDTWNDTKSNWKFMKTGVDMWQILYAEPLDKLPPQLP